MVPLRDENPTQITPYVTYGLIVLNVLIFGYELSLSPGQLSLFMQHWAVVPIELTASFGGFSAVDAGEWGTLITSQFLHGGFLHVAGNMLYLWIFGNNVEEQLGRIRFLLFYLACGALAVLTQWFFNPLSVVPSLGASGAIAGVMGAYIFRFPQVRILTLVPLGIYLTTFRIPAILYLGFWFLQQAFYGVASLDAPVTVGMEAGGIAYWAHAGGFVFGAILGPLLGLFSKADSAVLSAED
ncbi:rhomboid family intramembrane serine protease [Acaryochloris marina]|uniref:Rhomboid family protein n=1 Tax=Acaryochloris marina (strain MBIC 11017) TaxID=329726 RepID=B0C5F2_ACAM1|nr:rhomboid family intramembrane serine protease [Acaryochloris marina]ABW27528.1 rhomboid family protein [Acaryochloris marina MBIC11017]BDM82263.1 rhomboid family intramembrane serine protease [Acaryochloris marina MBIC10699]